PLTPSPLSPLHPSDSGKIPQSLKEEINSCKDILVGRSSLKPDENQLRVGDLLNRRYQIVQIKSAGVLRQTYIVEDTSQSDNPQCVVKHFPYKSQQGNFSRRLFEREVAILIKLDNYSQIPRLLDCAEDDQGFYLVQELIVGKRLSTELPINKHWSKRWNDAQCVELLQDILGILEFVHSHGVIHADLKPKNLIRRSSDHKLVLIDFGAAYQLDTTPIESSITPSDHPKELLTMPPLGYMPREQLAGHPRPNSDLYALGIIAIQALTGMNPAQLPIDPDSGEINWQHQASVSEAIAIVLNQMVQQDCQKRYQSARDVLTILKTFTLGSEEKKVSKEELSEELVLESQIVPTQVKFFDLNWFKLPPFMTGMGVGMAACNTIVISFGLYSLLISAPANPELDLLERAKAEYEAGNFNKAIALAKSVPKDSSVYQQSVTTVQKWRREWHIAEAQFQAAEKALHEERWRDVLEEARKTPNITFWQTKIQPLVEQAKPKLEEEAQQLLDQAYQRAAHKDFTGAIVLLKQISPDTPAGIKIQPKLAEYQEKQRIKAEYLLQQAYDRASQRDFSGAVKYLSQIPEDTPTYETAQIKIAEYSQKQNFKEEVDRVVELATTAPRSPKNSSEPFNTKPFLSGNNNEKPSQLNPGTQMQEVSPQPTLKQQGR
ncbi:MAG TPA: hypothetical protein DCY91_21170, partial [Cyanobacteria bacterium UBA11370]|nr:hypothetical protein [Cyanobacteria bacterium UBA11370]